MKIIPAVLVAAALCAACKKKVPEVSSEPAAPATPAPAVDNSATRYVNTLQNDVKRAEDAAAKMTGSIKQTSNGVNQAIDAQ